MYVEEIIKSTNAYKIISGDKKRNTLSHAYLIICSDGESIRDYLKIFVIDKPTSSTLITPIFITRYKFSENF